MVNMDVIKHLCETVKEFFTQGSAEDPKHGKWKSFNREAILTAEGYFRHGRKDGLWKQYYETGELLIEEVYEQGVLHGRYASYHVNGRLLSEGEYSHGTLEGIFRIYDDGGNLVKKLLFRNNVLVEETSRRGRRGATLVSVQKCASSGSRGKK
jgi:antitoxin component YwqK of YwqJK toxin-antitoxin module